MTATSQTAAFHRASDVIFIPSPLRVCGNCGFWIGPRVRNGIMGYAALDGVIGICSHRARKVEIPEELLSDATPMSNPDCPIWETA
jgi:hypothetical protein